MVNCPLCSSSQFKTVSKLLSHIRIAHADAENIQIQCSLQKCKWTFKKFSTYRNHIYNFHDIGKLEESGESAVSTTTNFTYDLGENDISSVLNDNEDCLYPLLSLDDLQIAAAIWIFKNREHHHLPLAVMDSLITDIQSLFNVSLLHVGNRVSSICNRLELTIPQLKQFCQHLVILVHVVIFSRVYPHKQSKCSIFVQILDSW